MQPAPQISEHPVDVLRFCRDEMTAGYGCGLVTVVATEGPSSRNPGTQMAVSARGVFAGYVSNGCIDAAIAWEALACLSDARPPETRPETRPEKRSGGLTAGSRNGPEGGAAAALGMKKKSRRLRYGAGSPFMDIKLPCGGALEIVLTPSPDQSVLTKMVAELDARRPVSFFCDEATGEIHLGEEAPYPVFQHLPMPFITLAGRGAEARAFMELAAAAGYPLRVLSPDDYILERAQDLKIQATTLKTANQIAPIITDPFSAILLLFHDHDWEHPLLEAALAGESFYIGAMGSRRTHHRRLEALYRAGVTKAAAARIKGPVGLIPGARDAKTMAISALSEIIATYHSTKNANMRADLGG